jgi:Fe-S cluster assembly scaffold protein SufB
MTRGLTYDEAVATLVLGFLKIELPGLPAVVTQHLERVLAATAGRSL